MSKVVVDQIERTKEYSSFIKELNSFHQRKGTTLRSEPVLGGKKIDLYKLYKEVLAGGGYNQVTKSRTWKHIGDTFNFPSTCTNSAYILKGVYARNLLGFEEEKIWGEEWIVPEELKGPDAHKLSTLAGKSYKYCKHHNPRHLPYKPIHSKTILLPSLTTRSDHTCEISETHHKTLPTEHVHSTDDANDCLAANEFDEQHKSQVIQSLRSDNASSLEWALNKIVTVSYESPQKLLLVDNPILLDFLLEKADSSVEHTLFPSATGSSTHIVPNHVLKILHIFRNFSFIESNIKVFAGNNKFKQLLIKCLVMTDSSYYSHCVDVLENMAPFIELGPFDPIIGCLTNLLLKGTERSVILGSVRILTLLANNEEHNNMFYLILSSEQVANRITELLVVNDEELIGASLEYLYHYSKQSTAFSQYLLNLHYGADIGIMVSLLMTPFKYFRPVIVSSFQDSPKSSTAMSSGLLHHHQHHSNEPCIPNLTFYQQLDEPYRCLGWLKDKFELGPDTSELSMDDMYLLYEMRFGHEKALKMRDFYTVLKIAFPIVTQAIEQQGAVKLEGTTIRGLQVKMCILQDGSELMCQWNNCSKEFQTEQLLQNHILHDHAYSENNCQWMDCNTNDVVDLNTHIRHDHLAADMSDIQGVALVAAQLLKVLSRHPNSHGVFIPYESELLSMMTKRPKLEPFIESIFENFEIACPSTASSSCSPSLPN